MAKHTTAAPELFRRSPGPEPEKPKDIRGRCCDHLLSDHCKSGVIHENHKEIARMIQIKYLSSKTPCRTRHCKHPLCCCVDFKE